MNFLQQVDQDVQDMKRSKVKEVKEEVKIEEEDNYERSNLEVGGEEEKPKTLF